MRGKVEDVGHMLRIFKLEHFKGSMSPSVKLSILN